MNWGYAAIEVADGTSALKVLWSDVRIDLLITDIGFRSAVNGRQMAEAARQSRPKLPVLFITGYPDTTPSVGGRLDAQTFMLAKPFSMEMLTNRITAILAETKATQSPPLSRG